MTALRVSGFSFLILSCCLCWILSCTKEKLDPNQPIRARVLKLLPLPSGASASTLPSFKISEETFFSLKSLEALEGDFMDMVEGGEQLTDEDSNLQTLYKGGTPPFLRYSIHRQTVIPEDFRTLWLLSVFYQFDSVLSLFEQLTGMDLKRFIQKNGKIRVWIAPTHLFQNSKKNLNKEPVREVQKLNVAYTWANQDRPEFLLYALSTEELIPLSANLQVIAHEFGHLLFHSFFFSSPKVKMNHQDPYFLKSNILIQGLDEGLADFVSYTVTGSTNVLSASLSEASLVSQRNFFAPSFLLSDLSFHPGYLPTEGMSGGKKCGHGYYCLGTLFAHLLFQIQRYVGVSLDSFDQRAAFLKCILTTHQGWMDALVDPRKTSSPKPPEAFLGDILGSSLSRFQDPTRGLASCGYVLSSGMSLYQLYQSVFKEVFP